MPVRLRGGGDNPSATDNAINGMRSRALDSGVQNEQVLDALKLMSLYCENVVKNPSELKFRRIKASNKAFATKVAVIDGATDVLAACGFAAVQEAAQEGSDPETFYKLPAYADLEALKAAVGDIKRAMAFSERLMLEISCTLFSDFTPSCGVSSCR